jgi:surface antigen
MTPNGVDSLDLMRLVDGELPPGEAARLARRCRDDPTAGAAIAALQAERALLRAAFPPEAPGGEDRAAIDAALAGRGRRAGPWPRAAWRAALPLAASILTAVVIGSGAVVLAERRAEDAVARVLAEQARDRALTTAALQEALDRQVSGQSVAWSNPDSGSRGSITPLRTFRAADGRWCREFERRVEATALGAERRTGIACRDPSGWRLQLERPGGEA